jgi:hypothetical protein
VTKKNIKRIKTFFNSKQKNPFLYTCTSFFARMMKSFSSRLAVAPRVLQMRPRAPQRLAHAGSGQARGPAPKYKFEDLYAVNHLGLPRLPIPDLDKTLDRYLESLRCVLAKI